jgi:signal peptidase II
VVYKVLLRPQSRAQPAINAHDVGVSLTRLFQTVIARVFANVALMPLEARLLPAAEGPSPGPGMAPQPQQTEPSSVTRRPLLGGLVWWVIVAVIVVDQITKALVARSLPMYSSAPIIRGFADLVHVHNAGVAFGLLNDPNHPGRKIVTTALAVAALAGIAYYSRHVRPHERVARVGLSLILGGAIGNLTDRVRQGFVVDFVDVYWRDWHFWAFNVADAAITIGAVLIFVELLLPSRHASHPV